MVLASKWLFPVVLAVYLLPGYLEDDLQDVAELFDADRGVAVHRSPFWLANPWFLVAPLFAATSKLETLHNKYLLN